MKIENQVLLEALKKKGAKVDFKNELVSMPKKLVEEVIEIAKKDEKERIASKTKDPDSELEYPNKLTFNFSLLLMLVTLFQDLTAQHMLKMLQF